MPDIGVLRHATSCVLSAIVVKYNARVADREGCGVWPFTADASCVIRGKVGGDTSLPYTKCVLLDYCINVKPSDIISEGVASPVPECLLAEQSGTYLRLWKPRKGKFSLDSNNMKF